MVELVGHQPPPLPTRVHAILVDLEHGLVGKEPGRPARGPHEVLALSPSVVRPQCGADQHPTDRKVGPVLARQIVVHVRPGGPGAHEVGEADLAVAVDVPEAVDAEEQALPRLAWRGGRLGTLQADLVLIELLRDVLRHLRRLFGRVVQRPGAGHGRPEALRAEPKVAEVLRGFGGEDGALLGLDRHHARHAPLNQPRHVDVRGHRRVVSHVSAVAGQVLDLGSVVDGEHPPCFVRLGLMRLDGPLELGLRVAPRLALRRRLPRG
mmetsp:Transcript_11094/g.31631  ORF Transcript_11094/g.31631 Transcript_11094/m.31631 type:complete len:265 (+) Transcript_11094:860-1654(+)